MVQDPTACTHMDMLWQALIENRCILLVSNAAVQHNSHATCAWVIWSGDTPVDWRGHIPGKNVDMYSRLAEAYGIATILMFLHQYTLLYLMIIHQPGHIHLYCDNQGVIECIQELSKCAYPHDAICNDYNICICRDPVPTHSHGTLNPKVSPHQGASRPTN